MNNAGLQCPALISIIYCFNISSPSIHSPSISTGGADGVNSSTYVLLVVGMSMSIPLSNSMNSLSEFLNAVAVVDPVNFINLYHIAHREAALK